MWSPSSLFNAPPPWALMDYGWWVNHVHSKVREGSLMDIFRLLHLLQVGVHSMNLLWLRAFTHVLQVAPHNSCALDLMQGKQVVIVSSIYLQWYVVSGCIPFATSSHITMLALTNPLRSEPSSIDLSPSCRCYCMHTLSLMALKGQNSSTGSTSRVLLISLLNAFRNWFLRLDLPGMK